MRAWEIRREPGPDDYLGSQLPQSYSSKAQIRFSDSLVHKVSMVPFARGTKSKLLSLTRDLTQLPHGKAARPALGELLASQPPSPRDTLVKHEPLTYLFSKGLCTI